MSYLQSFTCSVSFIFIFFNSLICQQTKRYKLALIPLPDTIKTFEALSKQHISQVSTRYLLGNNNIPHISLCQFECKKSEITKIFNDFYQEFQKASYTPTFSGLSLMKLGKQPDRLHAAELSVARSNEILTLHKKAVSFVALHGQKVLNPSGDLYRPHLRLSFFNSTKTNQTTLPLALPDEIFLNREFIVGIGSADLNWQLNNIIVASNEGVIQQFLKRTYQYSSEKIKKFYITQEKMGVTLKEFLDGEIYSKKPYTQEEKISILFNLDHIILEQFCEETFSESPSYISTAGPPGAGKSFFIEQKYGSHPAHAIYIDLEQVCLAGLSCYQRDRKIHGEIFAYKKWQDASNFMANFLLIKASAESRNIIHGTTASSPEIISVYKHLKETGYSIQVELLLATAEQQAAALEQKSQKLITQKTAQNFLKPILSRLHDAYLSYADKLNIYFQSGNYWRGSGEILKYAEFTQNNRTFTIINAIAEKKFNQEIARALSEKEAKEYKSKFEALNIKIN